MNAERKLTLIYFILGILMGIVPKFVNNSMLIIAVGVGLFTISFFVVRQFIKENKKLTWYLLNTAVTFVLVWLVTWIFVFNM